MIVRQALRRPTSLRSGCPKSVQSHYHSYEHERTPLFTPPEDAILSASLAHVPELGFTVDTLTQGARDARYPDISVNLFPAGPFALVHYHLVNQRLALGSKQVEQHLSVDSKIKAIALERLRANTRVIHKWQEALALMAAPSHVPSSVRELGLLADEILFLAGDKSVDTSWYTKRLALSTIYASSELFMTTDNSTNFAETEAFLSRRLNESRILGNSLRDTGVWLGVQGIGFVNGLRSKGIRI